MFWNQIGSSNSIIYNLIPCHITSLLSKSHNDLMDKVTVDKDEYTCVTQFMNV